MIMKKKIGKSIALEWVEELNISKSETLLDIGCGNGDTVYLLRSKGYQAIGIDVEFKEGNHTKQLIEDGYINKISDKLDRKDIIKHNQNYQWPVKTDSIGFCFSSSVIEHVANLDEFAKENKRVLKPKGLCLHYYPSKTALLEAHTGILLGGLLQHKKYITTYSKLFGTYKEFKNSGNKSYEYIKKYTHYKWNREIIKIFKSRGLRYMSDASYLTAKNKDRNILRFAIKNIKVIESAFNITRSYASLFIKD
ncbi:class I SAM-dependent methyltransferase [bacterium]|nr:class I SAM-dependent methyltransferase [bacterium]